LGIALRAGLLVVFAVVAVAVSWRVWEPDPVQLNLHFAETLQQYNRVRSGFEEGRVDCLRLADAYAAADNARVRAAVGFSRLETRGERASVREYERLSANMGRIDAHFDTSGCARP
jgi:hypothetical protein